MEKEKLLGASQLLMGEIIFLIRRNKMPSSLLLFLVLWRKHQGTETMNRKNPLQGKKIQGSKQYPREFKHKHLSTHIPCSSTSTKMNTQAVIYKVNRCVAQCKGTGIYTRREMTRTKTVCPNTV